jgi:hypothetical protein
MIGLYVFAASVAVVSYICAIFYLGGKLQDWASSRHYPDVLIPWAFCMIMLLGLPASIIAEIAA